MKSMQVVIASGNQGKLREIQALLPAGISAVPQGDLGIESALEDGKTFFDNAFIKAKHAFGLSGLPTIADDSGLAVDALDGAPGVHSARYAGNHATDRENIAKLLAELKHIPHPQRGAHFRCCIIFYDGSLPPVRCEGIWRGRIADSPSGEHGFGYDPVFIADGFDKTAARLAAHEKNRISHRAQALSQLTMNLAQYYDEGNSD